jgi:hypothetical protein
VIDKTVSSVGELVTALGDLTVSVVLYDLASDTTNGNTIADTVIASDGIIIPAGKTVYLVSTDTIAPQVLIPSSSGLTVHGALIVSESTILGAQGTGKVFLANTGKIQIQAGGALWTDKLDSITDLPVSGVQVKSVLSRVNYAKGSGLGIVSEPGLGITDIEALLSYITAGLGGRSVEDIATGPSKLTLQADLTGIKPSQIKSIEGILADRMLKVTPVAAEDDVEITIPAGAEVTIKQALPLVTTLTVNGILDAKAAIGSSEGVSVSVTPGASLTVGVSIAISDTSRIAGDLAGAGYTLGTNAKSEDIFQPGATIDGVEVKADAEGKVIPIINNAASGIVIDADKTAQIAGKLTVPPAGNITIPPTATLLIPKGASLTIGEGSYTGTLNVAGTIRVAGDLIIDTGSVVSGFTGTFVIEDGGTSYDTRVGGGSLGSGGTSIIHKGAKVYLTSGGNKIERVGGEDATLYLTDGSLTMAPAAWTLAGYAILNDDYGVTNGLTFTIQNNHTLTIKKNATLYVFNNGTLSVAGKIVGEKDNSNPAKIWVAGTPNQGDIPGKITGNGTTFYKISVAAPVEPGVYSWSTIGSGTTATEGWIWANFPED